MTRHQRISAHLWYDKEAKEAAQFYVSCFGQGSKIVDITLLSGTPSGTVDIVTCQLLGQKFTLLSAGPLFTFNPSISFLVSCSSMSEVDVLWKSLSAGGKTLMPLDRYPFSERYGWTEDRYGLSWQVMFRQVVSQQRIIPTLMFSDGKCGKAEDAMQFYAQVFKPSAIGSIVRYEKTEKPDREGTVKHAGITLCGVEFAVMDSARVHQVAFNEAISFIVHCQTQQEIDRYWSQLSAVPAAEACGWLKDKYGVSWQIVPTAMDRMLQDKDPKKLKRLTEAFLKMKKFDIAQLQKAYEGK
jgi:predicted 3-demethylubiquinone-9 3-methyltransferase (glyoxalase superfamily)